MPPETGEQIQQVSATVDLRGRRPLPELLHKEHQVPLKLLLTSEVGQEPLKKRLHEHANLTVADVVGALGFHECILKKQYRGPTDDFVTHMLHQPLTHILQH